MTNSENVVRPTDECGPEDWDGEGLEGDYVGADCHGYFPDQGPRARFNCGAVGSEDCDECPMNSWLGLTNSQIDELEADDD